MHRTKQQPSRIELPREAGEGAALWFALVFPIVIFCSWLMGLLFLHAWLGFAAGLLACALIARRLAQN